MLRRVFAVFVLACSVAAPAAAQDLKAQGEKLFTDQKCTLCHSVAGKGNAKGPMDEIGSKLSAADIRAWITDAKGMTAKSGEKRQPAMKEYTLAKGDVDALVAYVSSLKKK